MLLECLFAILQHRRDTNRTLVRGVSPQYAPFGRLCGQQRLQKSFGGWLDHLRQTKLRRTCESIEARYLFSCHSSIQG